jgi:hypothetical protein
MQHFFLAAGILFAIGSAGPSPQSGAPASAEAASPTAAERTRGLERRDGFLPFYWDARRGQILLETSSVEGDFLYGAGLAGGAGLLEVDLDRGNLGDLGVCRFERVGPRVLLLRLQTTHASGVEDRERTRVVEESFPISVLASLPIIAEEGDRVLADATAFVLEDARVLPALKAARAGEWKQDSSRSALRLERSGAFPLNTEIETMQTFVAEHAPPAVAEVLPDGRTMSLSVHHTFRRLPEPGYRPRPFDPRVGFIPVRRVDHTAPFTEPIEKYLASRWRLEKKDPSAAVSEPAAPIVYYLDRGIPSPSGPRSARPRSGGTTPSSRPASATRSSSAICRPARRFSTRAIRESSGSIAPSAPGRSVTARSIRARERSCTPWRESTRTAGARRRACGETWSRPDRGAPASPPMLPISRFSQPAAEGAGEEALVLQRLAYLSAHEVGHTLGLEHNWAATTFGWGSVMDYLAPNVQTKGDALDLSDAYPKDVGSYDRLAIAWGYTPESDPARLDAIVREGYAKGIVYPLDSDPRWAEYDWGSDPVAWLATTQRVRRVILSRFGAGQLAPGEWISSLQERFNLAYLYHRFGIQAAQQFVGGQFQTGAAAGDGQTPLVWVPAAKQREALDLLLAALEPENLDIPDRVLAALLPEPSATRPSRERFASEAGPGFRPPDGGANPLEPDRGPAPRSGESRASRARRRTRRSDARSDAGASHQFDLRRETGRERAARLAPPRGAAAGGRRPPRSRRVRGRPVLGPIERLGADRAPAPIARRAPLVRRPAGGAPRAPRAGPDGIPRETGDAQGPSEEARGPAGASDR